MLKNNKLFIFCIAILGCSTVLTILDKLKGEHFAMTVGGAATALAGAQVKKWMAARKASKDSGAGNSAKGKSDSQ